MNYINEINEKIDFVNQILNKIEQPPIQNNTDFIVNNMTMESWFKLDLVDHFSNRIPLSLTFTKTNLEIRLDRVAEALDWSNTDLLKSSETVNAIMCNLLTSYILVEYFGNSRTKIRFFNNNGYCTNVLKYRDGFSIRLNKRTRLYKPIYHDRHTTD